ncbi:MAG: VC_2705 family sodium/solute symporter [Brachymonas denitrificans]
MNWQSPNRVHFVFVAYVLGTMLFVVAMGFAEQLGLSREWLGGICLMASILSYALIGIYCRTTQISEYYVAGRRISGFYNGMASAADWMSAATFISLAGGLYLQGFSGSSTQAGGFAYLLGWTGGFCLVALLAAPYLRRMQLYTLPGFFEQRYGGDWPRRIAMLATVVCTFIYMVAQIYGVGLIASRLSGVRFEIGMLLGLSGVLVCSFLGGMRAVTWTQVAQYVILLLAFLVPVSLLAYKQLGNPWAPVAYSEQLARVNLLEYALLASPREAEVGQIYWQRALNDAQRLQDVKTSMYQDRMQLLQRLQELKNEQTDTSTIFAMSRALAQLPRTEEEARALWSRSLATNQARSQPLSGMPLSAQAYAGDPNGPPEQRALHDLSRRNFLALMFCLMAGTLGLPHLLTRYLTTPSVAQTRSSVAWTLFFIALLYVSIPALAIMVKFEVMQNLVGMRFDALPQWIGQWSRVDPDLLSAQDVNGDGILQFAELHLDADLVMLAMPEIAGLPYVVSALVAAGGLAAALSTADGLLLTMGTTIAHDGYYREINRNAPEIRRVMLSKFVLLVMALAAAYVAAQKPGDILAMVAASFSIAAATFVPAMVLGIFWRRATRIGAVAGMVGGLLLTVGYLVAFTPHTRDAWPILKTLQPWWGIQPVAAGVFGVPFGAFVLVVVSLLTQHTSAHEMRRDSLPI